MKNKEKNVMMVVWLLFTLVVLAGGYVLALKLLQTLTS